MAGLGVVARQRGESLKVKTASVSVGGDEAGSYSVASLPYLLCLLLYAQYEEITLACTAHPSSLIFVFVASISHPPL